MSKNDLFYVTPKSYLETLDDDTLAQIRKLLEEHLKAFEFLKGRFVTNKALSVMALDWVINQQWNTRNQHDIGFYLALDYAISESINWSTQYYSDAGEGIAALATSLGNNIYSLKENFALTGGRTD